MDLILGKFRTGRFRSFISGYASVFNIFGRHIDIPDLSRGFERDRAALAGDWRRVGGDMKNAMRKVGADGK